MGKATRNVEAGSGLAPRGVVINRMVDNPMMTEGLAAAGAGQRFVKADVNLTTLIGGLARVKGLTAMQIEAAARYRALWDAAQIGGARAIDYERVRVDTSGASADGALIGAMDGLEGYRRAVQALGMVDSALLDQVVCMGMSVDAVARRRGCNSGPARAAIKANVLRVLNRVAVHLGLGNRAAVRSASEAA